MYLRFPGQWEDAVWQDAMLGAEGHYNVNRWYQPATGGFIRPDPMGLRRSEARMPFVYGEANPIMWSDPLGLCTCDDECPEGRWTYIGYSWRWGLIGGLGASRGFYSCDSNPSARVLVRSVCGIYGVWAGSSIGPDFTYGNIPAACGCTQKSILGVHSMTYVGFGIGGVNRGKCGVSGSPTSFTLTGGPSFGLDAGVARVTCDVRPWRGWLDAIAWPF